MESYETSQRAAECDTEECPSFEYIISRKYNDVWNVSGVQRIYPTSCAHMNRGTSCLLSDPLLGTLPYMIRMSGNWEEDNVDIA